MAFQFDPGIFSVEGLNGEILPGTTLGWFVSGTSTPQATYSNQALTIPNANPVVVGADGRLPEIWLTSQPYKLVLTLPNGTVITRDPIVSESGTFIEDLDTAGEASGGFLVGYLPAGAGGVATDMQTAMRRRPLHAKDYGVVGDGVTDDTAAMNVAINAAIAERIPLYVPDDILTGALNINGPCEIIGTGGMTTLTAKAGSYIGISLNSSDITMQNLIFESAAKTGGADFRYNLGSTEKRRLALINTLHRDSFGMFEDLGTGTAAHIDTELNNVRSERLRGDGIKLTRAFAYVFLKKVSSDFVGVSTNSRGFYIDGSAIAAPDDGGIAMEDCNVLGSATQFEAAVNGQRGYFINDITSLETTNCKVDGVGEYGWAMFDVRDWTASLVAGVHCALGQFYFDTVTGADILGLKAIGRELAAYTYKPASRDNIYFNGGCDDMNFIGGRSINGTGNGVNLAAGSSGTAIDFVGFKSKENTLVGVRARGSGSFNYSAGTSANNTVDDYDLGSSLHLITKTRLTSGAVVDQAGPAAG